MTAKKLFFCLLSMAGLLPISASAQTNIEPAPVDVTLFFPAPSPGALFAVDSSGVSLKNNFGAGATLGFSLSPLVAHTGDEITNVVTNLTTLYLYGFYGFGKNAELAALFPFTGLYSQDLGDGAALEFAKPGDLKLRFKSNLVPARIGSPLGLAFVAEATLPTGAPDSFVSLVGAESGRLDGELAPSMVVEYLGGPLSLNLNIGYIIRRQTTLGSAQIDDRIEIGAGAAYTLSQSKKNKLQLIVESQGHVPIDLGAGAVAAETPVEARIGARFTQEPLIFQFGLGTGIPTTAGDSEATRGISAPLFRVFAGASFAPVVEEDTDKDGLVGNKDKCPTDPEDKDQFEDEDGCPDLDNDNDQLADKDDQCPVEAEDKDQFEDENGCPEPDNDQDNITDLNDRCINDKEDVDQFEDEDGCPELDNDGDGIADADDACPINKGDLAFKGCPDADQDTIADPSDKCPADAEDKDQFEDEDGCPELDNDQDTVADKDDACPIQKGLPTLQGCPDTDGDGFSDKDDLCINEKEDGKGKNPKDGCPDTTKAVLVGGKVVILDKIFFDTGKATIKIVSNPVLDGVVKVLKENPDVKVRVEGNTDDVGEDAANLKLSEERAKAVVAYLVKGGIDASRLQAKGNGEGSPLVPVAGLDPVTKKKEIDAAREKNRRVEFFVIE